MAICYAVLCPVQKKDLVAVLVATGSSAAKSQKSYTSQDAHRMAVRDRKCSWWFLDVLGRKSWS